MKSLRLLSLGSAVLAVFLAVTGTALHAQTPPPPTKIIDNGDQGFAVTPSSAWIPYPNQGYQNDVHYTAAGLGDAAAYWVFSNLAPGRYRVSATWSPYSNRATDAPYTVSDGIAVLGSIRINQELLPNDFTDAGVSWEDLGTFTVLGNQIGVKLANNANEYVIADAVRIERVSGLPSQPSADIAVTLSAPSTIASPQSLTYTATVKNMGTLNATAVAFTLALPPASRAVFVPGSSTAGCSVILKTVFCQLGTLTPNAVRTLTLTFRPSPLCIPMTVASVAFADGNEAELNPTNNMSSVVLTTVQCTQSSSSRSSSSFSSSSSSRSSSGSISSSSSSRSSSSMSSSSVSSSSSSFSSSSSSSSVSSSSSSSAQVTGNLYVTLSTTPIRNHQLLGGLPDPEEPILRLTMRAEGEDIDVTDLQLSFSGSLRSVDRLLLYKPGQMTSFAAATIGACGTDITPPQTMCAKMPSQLLVIANGTQTDVIVRPFMKSDVQGAVSGDQVQLYISANPVINFATGEGAVRARGRQSANNLGGNDGNAIANGEVLIGTNVPAPNKVIIGNRNVVVLSKIVSITNANPDANGTNVPAGISDIGQFKFTAAPNANSQNGLNKVVFSGAIFTVTSANVAFNSSGFRFFNKANPTVWKNCLPINTFTGGQIFPTASGSFLVKCVDIPNSSSVNTQIDQGTDQTFVLQADITNPAIVGHMNSLVQVSLQSFSDIGLNQMQNNKSHFTWIDFDFGRSTRFNWVDYQETVINSTMYQS